ncbi:MAG: AAA family ATPase [Prolixibacteraceae bacterium]|jgi:predicted ATP-binding protein involved in virulence|nr:AAA family ATPase [Prolixibacteraceae bacterium]
MENFLTHIKINKLFHLENIDIPIDEKEMKHLIITGKNGSGKTSLLNAATNKFNEIISHVLFPDKLSQSRAKLAKSIKNLVDEKQNKSTLSENEKLNISMSFSNVKELKEKIFNNDFLLTFYQAYRKPHITIPKHPEKPDLQIPDDIKGTINSQFLNFLVDLKSQEAFASTNDDSKEAASIKQWFKNFEELLREIFDTPNLKLEFNYKDYSFTINHDGRRFGFNQLADGYSAIIDIVSDLILKMQTPDSLTRAYEKEGIVLIDEVETHLHLELQRLILPMLTRIFPNIQFIVTTHSPFVLNSIENAVAFDLEKQKRLEDLTEYSYEALAEGYFNVATDSNFLDSKLNRFKELATKSKLDNAEKAEYSALDKEFSELNDSLAPQNIKSEYLRTKLTTQK